MLRFALVALAVTFIVLPALADTEGPLPAGVPVPAPQDPNATNLMNLADKPTAPRFPLTEKDWPEEGKASICLWADDKQAAYSLGVDDNFNEDIPWWEDASKKYGGLPITWFVITGIVGNGNTFHTGTWQVFQRLASEGFHIESHTVTHFLHLDPSWKGVEWDYSQSIADLDANIPNQHTHFLAYPGGANPNPNDRTIAQKYYLAARGTDGVPNVANKIDYMNTTGFHPAMSGKWNDPSNLLNPDPKNPNHQYYRGWAMMFWHHLDATNLKPDDSGSAAMTTQVLDYLTSHKDDLWAGFFGDVAMYGQERDTATLTVEAADATHLLFTLTDRMNPTYYTYPLTVKAHIPDAWKKVVAKQNDKPIEATIMEHDGGHFALVKAVPSQGQVTLTPAP